MTTRRLLVLDTETSGLRPFDVCVEVSWHDLGTDERGTFIPRHSVRWVLENGQPEALELNGYRDRIAEAKQDNGSEAARLHEALRGQRLAGANPAFDARHMERLFRASGMHPDPWHHRLADITNLTAGALDIDPADDLPGLSACCDLWGVPPGDHTAAADVEATRRCFLALAQFRASRKALMAKAGVSPTSTTKEAAA